MGAPPKGLRCEEEEGGVGEIAAAVDMEVQATPVSIAITNQTWCRIPIMLGAPIWHSVVRGHSLGDPSETGGPHP